MVATYNYQPKERGYEFLNLLFSRQFYLKREVNNSRDLHGITELSTTTTARAKQKWDYDR
jgi:hypothetical protein